MVPRFEASGILLSIKISHIYILSYRCFITTSRDMTARLFTLDPLEGFRPKTFAGHKDVVIAAYFSSDCKSVSNVNLLF